MQLSLLDDSSVLLWKNKIGDKFQKYDNSHSWYSLDFFKDNTKNGTLKIWDMKEKLDVIVVQLFKELISIRTKVLNSFCFWVVKDRDYYELVYKHNFEKLIADDIDELIRNYSLMETSYIEKDYDDFILEKLNKYNSIKA